MPRPQDVVAVAFDARDAGDSRTGEFPRRRGLGARCRPDAPAFLVPPDERGALHDERGAFAGVGKRSRAKRECECRGFLAADALGHEGERAGIACLRLRVRGAPERRFCRCMVAAGYRESGLGVEQRIRDVESGIAEPRRPKRRVAALATAGKLCDFAGMRGGVEQCAEGALQRERARIGHGAALERAVSAAHLTTA